MDVLVSISPILLLIFLMTKKRSVRSNIALPVAAAVLYLLQLGYFGRRSDLVHAAVIEGVLTSLTPILIVWGAILLFRSMEQSGGMDVIRRWLNQITPNRVGQLMIVGWSFSFLVEGASGFGTPAALAGPLLVGLGFSPLPVAVFCLIMNTVPVSFGAVGMPTWFGFAALELTRAELLETSFKTALLHGAAALVIPLLALRMMVSAEEIKRNIRFIYLSLFASVVPYVLVARWNYEFPSLLGGFVGLVISVLLARRSVGLASSPEGRPPEAPVPFALLWRAAFPLWGTILLLLVTRLEFLGFKAWLTSATPAWTARLGTLGELSVSSSLVVQLQNILGTGLQWSHAVLYVPSVIPFLVVSVLAFWIVPGPPEGAGETPWLRLGRAWTITLGEIRKPLGAFFGALVFVKLFLTGGEESSAALLGNAFASALGQKWQYAAPFLGALGSFFSGSNTVSNLTFGGIQSSAALTLGLDRGTILALQSAGGAMGNMICIHNIVAVCAILGLRNVEGTILKRTALPLLVYGLAVAAAGAFL